MSAGYLFPCWHRMGWLGEGLRRYVQDDFGALVQLSGTAENAQVNFTVGGVQFVDDAEAAYDIASDRVFEARQALRKAEAELLAALPPGGAQ